MIVVDVETTGLNPNKHSIISIGAIDFNNPKNQFYEECKIWEGAEIDQVALDVNGFTKEQITNFAKSDREAVEAFLSWADECTDKTLAGHNSWFDRDLIEVACERYNIPFTLGHRIIDLHSLVYTDILRRGLEIPLKKGRTDLNADRCFTYVGLLEEQKPHNALTGAKMEAEAFSRIVHGKSLLPEFTQYKLPEHLE